MQPRRLKGEILNKKRFAIAPAGLLCLALWACVQPAPTRLPSSVTCSDGSDLLTHAHYVQLSVSVRRTPQPGSVQPNRDSGSAQPNRDSGLVQPNRDSGSVQPNRDFSVTPDPTPIDPAIQNDLAEAFTANPAFSKNELCPLDGIFINREQCSGYDPSNCSAMQDKDIAANSWGLRTPSGKKYVAISLGLWRCQSGQPGYCAPKFTQYHQRLSKALLDKTAEMPVSISPPTFEASADTPALSILAALAHERGHIYWWETFVQRPGSTPDRTTLLSTAGGFCGGTIYPGGQWQGKPVGLPHNRYVEFGDLSPVSPVVELPYLLRYDAKHAVGIIDAIYAGGLYPSLLASFSPDEDFVEAFEWSVLRNGGLSELSVNIAGTLRPILVLGHTGVDWAEDKLHCFDDLSRASQQQR